MTEPKTTRARTRDAAPKQEVAKAPTKEVAKTSGGAVPAFLAEAAAADAGKGTSSDADDNLVPLIYILQAQSPQANKRNPDYVEGGEAGAIWLRNSGLPAISGETGILFQPCHFYKDWVEWVLRDNGGGFAGRHDDKPEEAVETPDQKDPSRTRWMLPNGNEVVETRYHIGNVYIEEVNADGEVVLTGQVFPYVIPMTGSAHTASRAWMFLMNSKKLPGGAASAPSWAALYRLGTKLRTNKKGEWMSWDIADAGWVQSLDDYNRGTALNAAFASGELKAADLDETAAGGGDAPAGEGAAM